MKSKILRYSGAKAAISYDVKRCIHAAECVHGLPDVFDPDRKPWIEPDGAEPEQLLEVVTSCPTGALRLERSDGEQAGPHRGRIPRRSSRTARFTFVVTSRSSHGKARSCSRTHVSHFAAVVARKTSRCVTGDMLAWSLKTTGRWVILMESRWMAAVEGFA